MKPLGTSGIAPHFTNRFIFYCIWAFIMCLCSSRFCTHILQTTYVIWVKITDQYVNVILLKGKFVFNQHTHAIAA